MLQLMHRGCRAFAAMPSSSCAWHQAVALSEVCPSLGASAIQDGTICNRGWHLELERRIVSSLHLCLGMLGGLLSGHYMDLRPRKFAMRLDVRMKRGASPYPRNQNRKRGVPHVKGIIRKILE
mmetsp:Transcript_43702/g.100883  ORF Transcript_43702/g.100883 Transcript_43702/m.100883 type:complete len:123 (-) Transcript_43702:40-408(-)